MQADVEIFKSDPPIPNSAKAKNQKMFHTPVVFNEDEPVVEKDPVLSTDESLDSEGDNGAPCWGDTSVRVIHRER